MRQPNIDNSLPQHVAFPISNFKLDSKVAGEDILLCMSLITAITKRIDDLTTYQDELDIKRINLILGREESLVVDKLLTLSQTIKDNLQSALLAYFEANPLTQIEVEKTAVNAVFNIPVETLSQELSDGLNLDVEDNETESVEPDEKLKAKNIPVKVEKKSKRQLKKDSKKLEKQIKKDSKKLEKQIKATKKFIQSQIHKLQKFVNDKCKLIKSTNEKQSKRVIKIVSKALNTFLKTMKKFDDLMDSIQEKVFQFQDTMKSFFKALEKSIKKTFSKLIVIVPQILTHLVIAYYGPPAFIGLWVLGIAAIITGISWLIAKYMPKLLWIFKVMIPAAAQTIKWLAECFLSIFTTVESIVVKCQELFDKYATKFLNVLKKVFEKYVKPILRKVFELFNKFKTEYWPQWLPIVKKLTENVMNFFSKDVINKIIMLINWIVDTALDLLTNIVMPILEPILKYTKIVLDLIKPWLKPLIDVIIKYSIIILNAIKPVVIEIANFLAYSFMTLLNLLGEFYTWLKDDVLSPIPKFVNSLLSVGKVIVDKILNILPEWLREGIAAVGKGIAAVGKAIWGFIAPKDKRANMTLPELKAEHSSLLKKYKELEPYIKVFNEAIDIKNISADSFGEILDLFTNIFRNVKNFCKQIDSELLNLQTTVKNIKSNIVESTAKPVNITSTAENINSITKQQTENASIEIDLSDTSKQNEKHSLVTIVSSVDKSTSDSSHNEIQTNKIEDLQSEDNEDSTEQSQDVSIEFCEPLFEILFEKLANRIQYAPLIYKQSKQSQV